MAYLGTEQVVIDDRVFDIANGYGTVHSISKKKFVVLFDNGRRIEFNANGSLGGTRRIYWHDPIVVAPPRDKTKWEGFIRLIVAVLAVVDPK